MKIKLWLLVSAFCVNTTWAAAADSSSMAPATANSGVIMNNSPQTYSNSWVRVVDRSSPDCKTLSYDEFMAANFNDVTKNDYGNVYGTSDCGTGYAQVGTHARSNIDKGTVITGSYGVVEWMRLAISVVCCPITWVKVPIDSNGTAPAASATPD